MDKRDPREDPEAQQRRIDTGCGDVIVVPLYYRERAIGTLTALNRADSRRLGWPDVDLVVAMGSQVAIAIETARLYEQARLDAETKAILLREVNHRVKNNLTSIIGLLYAKRRHQPFQDQEPYQTILSDLIGQVQGLATVHSMLSAAEWSPLRLSELAWQVIHASLNVLPSGQRLSTRVPNEPVRVTPRQANGLALVINELVTNTIKYSLPASGAGQIRVSIAQESQDGVQMVRFEYRDNGPGYPESVVSREKRNVGLYLVETLVRDELQGTLNLYNDDGAVTQIHFEALA
jgi:two-component sensor histidine kinase